MFFSIPTFALLTSQSPWLLGSWLLLFVVVVLLGAVANLFGLAGNWIMLGISVLHTYLVDRSMTVGFGLGFCLLLFFLALLGELMEFLSGILGAGKAGASRRAMILSMLGGMIGSFFGFGLGNVIFFILGGIIGIFFFGGLGALAGAMLGEMWKGSTSDKRAEVGRGAFVGRILGTLAKTMIGSLMLVLVICGLFV